MPARLVQLHLTLDHGLAVLLGQLQQTQVTTEIPQSRHRRRRRLDFPLPLDPVTTVQRRNGTTRRRSDL